MRLLHTGDLHLDCPFSSSDLLGADKKRELQRAMLTRIFDLAKTEECEMILIAGDLFDGRYVTPETKKHVQKLFSSVDIPIIISPGNHDPYVGGSFYKNEELPENVYVFSSNELQRFEFPELGVRVLGYAFTSSVMTESPLSQESPLPKNGYIDILCAHCDLASPLSRYCPVTPYDIANLGIDYAALGHIHNRDIDDSFRGATIRYCGFPEGRSFDELGDGGILIVDIDRGSSVSVKRISIAKQRYEICELDLSGVVGVEELRSVLMHTCDEYRRVGMLTNLRIVIYGTVYEEILQALCDLENELSDEELIVTFKNLASSAVDPRSLESDITIRGAFYKALQGGLSDPDPEVRERTARALRIGLAAIDGRRIVGEEDEI